VGEDDPDDRFWLAAYAKGSVWVPALMFAHSAAQGRQTDDYSKTNKEEE
jgi:hypothetical protein